MAFYSIVSLCRQASDKHVAGSDLVITATRSVDTVAWIQDIDAGPWNYTLRVDGADITKPVASLPEGAEFVLVVHGMVGSNKVVVNSVGDLLRYNQGEFLGGFPPDYYVIQEDYASGDSSVSLTVLAYKRTIHIISLLKKIADVAPAKANTAGEAIFFATKKIVIPLRYDASSLQAIPSESEIARLEDELFQEHHKAARLDIFKRVLTRFFDQELEFERFSQFLRRFREVKQAFDADFDIYVSGFSFDKVREDFERKKLEFVVKINSSSSDVMNKLIAIPVGQGLLASQMKSDATSGLANWALFVGSMVFAVIALMLLATQINTLVQIKQELNHEGSILKERAQPTYTQLKGMIDTLNKRLNLHCYFMPVALVFLLITTTAVTIMAFNHATPDALQQFLNEMHSLAGFFCGLSSHVQK